MDWLYPNSKTPTPIKVPAKEKAMKVTGVWTRKPEMEFPDKQVVNVVWTLVSRHPYTIGTIDAFSREYAAIFGEGEIANLKASLVGGKFNMVMSPNENWVKGDKVWIAPEPKEDSVLKEGYEWVQTPFGKTQQPIRPSVGFNAAQKDELGAIVYEHVLEALRTWSQG
jgi:hypothetical protein